MTPVPAHAGHWLVDLLYVLPVLLVLGVVGVAAIKERRARARGEVPEGAGGDPGPPARDTT